MSDEAESSSRVPGSPASYRRDNCANCNRAHGYHSVAILRLEHMNALRHDLYGLVWAYLCTLYYMECSIVPILLHLIPHVVTLSEKRFFKAEEIEILVDRLHVRRGQMVFNAQTRAAVDMLFIVLPNALCMILHLFWSPPAAGEATRGYLHGGIAIDLVGQKAPVPRFLPLLIDVLIFTLDLIIWSILREHVRSVEARLDRSDEECVGGPEPVRNAHGDQFAQQEFRQAPDVGRDLWRASEAMPREAQGSGGGVGLVTTAAAPGEGRARSSREGSPGGRGRNRDGGADGLHSETPSPHRPGNEMLDRLLSGTAVIGLFRPVSMSESARSFYGVVLLYILIFLAVVLHSIGAYGLPAFIVGVRYLTGRQQQQQLQFQQQQQ